MPSDSSSDLRAVAVQYIEQLWKADIHRDFDSQIKFMDGEKQSVPRPQSEIDQIHKQIEYYAGLLADELIVRWNDAGIYTLADTTRDPNAYQTLIKICTETFPLYSIKVSAYVKSSQPS